MSLHFVGRLVATITLAVGQAQAQATGTIIGRATDVTIGTPVGTGEVRVVGTQLRTMLTTDGRYVLRDVPAGAVQLRIAAIGYTAMTSSTTVTAGQSTTLDFALSRSVVTLEEVVTTATGEQSRRSVANVISTVKTDSIAKVAAVSSVSDILTARVPGVTVLQGYGMTGGTFNVRIRGVNSISLTNEPLWIIDGIRLETRGYDASGNVGGSQGLSAINPEDIETMDVIKGPSASALYGTQASNGVIVIRTKRGRAGKTQWQAYGEGGVVEQPAAWPDNYRSFGRNRNPTTGVISSTVTQCRINNAAAGTCVIDSLTTFNPLRNKETTPFGEYGDRRMAGMQASGGTENLRFFASGERELETGPYTMPANEIDRITKSRGSAPRENQIHPNKLDQVNARGNFTAVLRPDLNMNLSTAFTQRKLQTPFNASYFQGIQTQAITAPGFRNQFNGYAAQHLGDMMSMEQPTKENRYILSSTGNWTPNSWLTARLTTGLDQVFNNAIQFARAGEGPNGGWGSGIVGQGGGKYISKDNFRRISNDLLVAAVWNLREDLTTKTSVGGQYNTDDYTYTDASGYNLAPGATSTTSGSIRNGSETRSSGAQLGFYLDENIGWRDRLFVNFGVRTDKSSAFGKGYPRAYYPRAGVSWVLSQEGFFPKWSFLTDLRLRAAWGQAGIQPGATTALQTLSASSVVSGNSALPTLRLSSLGNADIKPEVVTEHEFGFELGLLSQRVSIEATYFNKVSDNGIGSIPLPPSLGAATSQVVNISSVRNRGIEYAIDANIIQLRNLSWNFRLSGSTLSNEVLDMGTLPQPFGTTRTAVGYPIGGFWQRPIKSFADANNDGIIVESEIVTDSVWKYLGPSLPKYDAAITNTFGFLQNRLNVMAMLDFRGGNIHNWSMERDRCNGGNCRAVNDPKAPLDQQAAAVATTSSRHFNTLDGYLKKADFLRLREVSATYKLPTRIATLMRAQNAMLVVAGRNLLMVNSKYPGLDPEAGGQFSEVNWQPPPLRYFISRITLTF
jgi:TonB-linked SusC/RagA family outer membrane protein